SHSTSTTAFLVAVARLYGTSAPLAGIPVMMLSRMVLGVHYPTDTAFGAALGAATAEAITRYERKTAGPRGREPMYVTASRSVCTLKHMPRGLRTPASASRGGTLPMA